MITTKEQWQKVINAMVTIDEFHYGSGRAEFAIEVLGPEQFMEINLYSQSCELESNVEFATEWVSLLRTTGSNTYFEKTLQSLEIRLKEEGDREAIKKIINQLPEVSQYDTISGVSIQENLKSYATRGKARRKEKSNNNVRFTIACTGSTNDTQQGAIETSAHLRITDPDALQQEMKFEITVPLEIEKQHYKNYVCRNPKNPLDATTVSEAIKYCQKLGERLFKSVFNEPAALTALHTTMLSNRDLEIAIEGPSFFQSLPWELLWYTYQGSRSPICIRVPIIRQVSNAINGLPSNIHRHESRKEPIRVLLFSARMPNDKIPEDAVKTAIEQKVSPDRLTIAHVSTGKLGDLIGKIDPKNHEEYDILHLDMHGALMSQSEFNRSGGAYYKDDRPFGLHGLKCGKEKIPYLFFNQENKIMPVSCSELNSLIRRTSFIAMNACCSAAVGVGSGLYDGAYAADLVARLGCPAVGFQEDVSLVAVQKYYAEFYRKLTEDLQDCNYLRAHRAGLFELFSMNSTLREYGEKWPLPVLYCLQQSRVLP
jgi:hypothetical protein